MPNMTVSNGRDADENQIFDVSFVVGEEGIRRGHTDGLSTGDYYTEIRIYFENTEGYDRGLGLGIGDGELTGCSSRNIFFNQ